MKWLDRIIHRRFATMHAIDRERVCEQILEGLPRDLIVNAIRTSAAAVLHQRGVYDEGGELAQEIANNATGSILVQLEIGPRSGPG